MKKFALAAIATFALAAAPAAAAPTLWESNFGVAIVSGDDVTTTGTLSFAMPIFGNSYTAFEASTNGFISLGGLNGNDCCDGIISEFLNGAPRISAEWFDLVGTVYHNNSVAGRSVFTWQGSAWSGGGSYTYQAHLFSNGNVAFGFNSSSVPTNYNPLVGITPGGGAANPGESDLSAANFSSGTVSTIYEQFSPGSTFDLNQMNVYFTPNGRGGFLVSTTGFGAVSPVPEPATWAFMITGFGLVGGALRSQRRRTLAAA